MRHTMRDEIRSIHVYARRRGPSLSSVLLVLGALELSLVLGASIALLTLLVAGRLAGSSHLLGYLLLTLIHIVKVDEWIEYWMDGSMDRGEVRERQGSELNDSMRGRTRRSINVAAAARDQERHHHHHRQPRAS